MTFNLNDIIKSAIHDCNSISESEKIYPFTTENINGYINNFNLYDSSLLTVGSSGDQVINAILHGSKDITLLDKNKYTKYYYYLKMACILCLSIDEFLEFLRYKDYPKVFKDNNMAFNIKTFNKIKPTLRVLDYESYLFWDELFQSFDPFDIRKSLFSHDEYRTYVIEGCNDYLLNYDKTKELIKNVNPQFIYGDLFKTELNRKYDNIWLSNIGTYLSRHFTKKMVDIMDNYLNQDGQMLVSYLYKTEKDTEYQDDWSPIYNLPRTFEILKEYAPDLISFSGIDALKFKEEDMKDSILIYRKK